MRFSLKFKIALLICILLLIILFFISGKVIRDAKKEFYKNFIKTGALLVKNFALNTEKTLLTGNELELEELIEIIIKPPEVINAYIVLNDNTYYLHNKIEFLGKKYKQPEILKVDLKHSYRIIKKNNKILYQFFYPVINPADNKAFGISYVEIIPDYLESKITSWKVKIYIFFFLIFIAGVVGSILLADFVTKPVYTLVDAMKKIGKGNLNVKVNINTKDELQILGKGLNQMVKELKIAQQRMIENKLLEQEMMIAKEIQNQILPEKLPTIQNFELNVFYRSSQLIGGDYYTFFNIKNKKGVFVADVTGKGVPAALLTMIVHTIFHSGVRSKTTLKGILSFLDSSLRANISNPSLITGLTCLFNKTEITLASAGHDYPVLFSIKEKKFKFINLKGLPIGALNSSDFKKTLKEKKIKLKKNDCLIIYTDGLRLVKGKPMNNQALLNFLNSFIENNVFNSQKFYNFLTKTKNLKDDITVIMIKRR